MDVEEDPNESAREIGEVGATLGARRRARLLGLRTRDVAREAEPEFERLHDDVRIRVQERLRVFHVRFQDSEVHLDDARDLASCLARTGGINHLAALWVKERSPCDHPRGKAA